MCSSDLFPSHDMSVTGTRRKICKVCYAAGKGVKEIGKLQRVKELLVQGMKRCTDCKNDVLTFVKLLSKRTRF